MLALRSGKTRQPQTGNSKWHLLGSRPLWWQLEQGLWGDHWDITAHSQLLSGLQAVMPRSPSGSQEVCVCCNWLETQRLQQTAAQHPMCELLLTSCSPRVLKATPVLICQVSVSLNLRYWLPRGWPSVHKVRAEFTEYTQIASKQTEKAINEVGHQHAGSIDPHRLAGVGYQDYIMLNLYLN